MMRSRTASGVIGWSAGVLVAALLPLWLSVFQVVQLTVFLIYSLLAISLNLIWGYGGILSFGQAAFFGVGGYVYGVIGGNVGSTTLALLGTIGSGAVLALLVGYFAFYGRIGSTYFAIITLTVTLILYAVISSTGGQEYAIGKVALGGFNGMRNIPSLSLEFPGGAPRPLEPIEFYYVVAGTVLLTILALQILLRAPFGRVLISIRENAKRTELLGYDVRLYQLIAFMASGAVGGLGGGLFASWGNFMNPDAFGLVQSALIVIWVLVGGRGTLLGPLIGTIVIQYLTSTLGTIFLSDITTISLGVLFVVLVLLFPKGLVPTVADLARWLWGRASWKFLTSVEPSVKLNRTHE